MQKNLQKHPFIDIFGHFHYFEIAICLQEAWLRISEKQAFLP